MRFSFFFLLELWQWANWFLNYPFNIKLCTVCSSLILMFFISVRLPSVRGQPSSSQESADKKRESRKSGFFNLIKSRTSRSEKSHGAAAITPPQPLSSSAPAAAPPVSPVTEEATPAPPSPRPPTPPAKPTAAVVESYQELHRAPSPNHTDSEVESSPTAAAAAAEEEREEQQEEVAEKKEHPHIPRHIGVPVMGMDLMAEMKARMAVKKVGGVIRQ